MRFVVCEHHLNLPPATLLSRAPPGDGAKAGDEIWTSNAQSRILYKVISLQTWDTSRFCSSGQEKSKIAMPVLFLCRWKSTLLLTGKYAIFYSACTALYPAIARFVRELLQNRIKMFKISNLHGLKLLAIMIQTQEWHDANERYLLQRSPLEHL